MKISKKECEHEVYSSENDSKMPLQQQLIIDIKTRTGMQPILDALQNGDYSFAATLCPDDTKLIGYEIVESPSDITQYGSYAADFWTTRVSPGVYPIFAKAYSYNEAKESYTNQINDFNGLFVWKEGIIVSSNYIESVGKENIVFETPYAHSIAHIVSEYKNSNIHLLPPFCAQKIYFTYDGEIHHTYQITDRSLPELLQTNPIKLKSRQSIDTLLKKTNRPSRPSVLADKNTRIR